MSNLIPIGIFNETNNLEATMISINGKLFSDELINSNWRFVNSFQNYKLESNNQLVQNYIKKREHNHYYDPRITLSVYLNQLNETLEDENYTQDFTSIPFSWEDWVDLSYMNQFLKNDHSRLSCAAFFKKFNSNVIIDDFDEGRSSLDYMSETNCLDDKDYLETSTEADYRDSRLLPGFNFNHRMPKESSLIGKILSAKSYVLSNLKPPKFLYFLNDSGSYYRVRTHQSKSMMRNSLFEKLTTKQTFHEFNPTSQLNNLNKKFMIKNENSFLNQLNEENNFEIDVSAKKFNLDAHVFYKDLFEKQHKAAHVTDFINALEYSSTLRSEDLPKHFDEVHIILPEIYNGHAVTENGAHYDFRFFSGFLTEMPESEYTVHSPEYTSKKHKNRKHVDTPSNRRPVILSSMIHTLLTTAFHEGLVMYPAHGSLLAWYFTGASFPWDSDGDVQMPIEDLAQFCLNYNQSMVIQNPKLGFGKYYLDCTGSITHRAKGNGANNIDARFIDIDTGYYVDITGLGVSHDALTQENLDNLDEWVNAKSKERYPVKTNDTAETAFYKEKVFRIHEENHIFNCRNNHYYTLNQLSPVRVTLFEGAPAMVPSHEHSLRAILASEYTSEAVKKKSYDYWIFSQPLKMWVHLVDVYWILKNNNIKASMDYFIIEKTSEAYPKHENLIISELIKASLYDITENKMFNINRNKAKNKHNKIVELNTYQDLFQSKILTDIHSKEMSNFIFDYEWNYQYNESLSHVPTDWNKLASYMLDDHKPAKISMFDFLIFSENEYNGQKITIN